MISILRATPSGFILEWWIRERAKQSNSTSSTTRSQILCLTLVWKCQYTRKNVNNLTIQAGIEIAIILSTLRVKSGRRPTTYSVNIITHWLSSILSSMIRMKSSSLTVCRIRTLICAKISQRFKLMSSGLTICPEKYSVARWPEKIVNFWRLPQRVISRSTRLARELW